MSLQVLWRVTRNVGRFALRVRILEKCSGGSQECRSVRAGEVQCETEAYLRC